MAADEHGDDDLDELGGDGEPPTPEVIEDSDSYVQSQRLKDIFDARRNVRKQRMEMKKLMIDADDHGDVRAAKRGYRAAVETYLQEIRPLFMRDEQGQEVWFNLNFGTLRIQTTNEQTEPKEIDLYGLNYLFELPEPIVVEFEWTKTTSGTWGDSVQSETITKRHDIGFDRLDRLVDEANHRLEQRGLDLELNDGDEDSWEI